ncbi:MAG: hypothetical protein L3J04_00915 [Robiginitomaculum sp.]|nr:hypothetical protein [Robiginitomaculum sp.]
MEKLITAKDVDISLNEQGEIFWSDKAAAKLVAGTEVLKPQFEVLAEVSDVPVDEVRTRLVNWLQAEMAKHLAPLLLLHEKVEAGTLDPAVLGLGFRLLQALGSLDRRGIATELKTITQDQRGSLRECGVRFGEFSLFMPALLRPAPSRLLAILLAFGPQGNKKPYIAPAGLTSFKAVADIAPPALSVAGLRKCAERSVRLDILERIGAEIRTARGQTTDGGFKPTLEMVALLGCSKPELAQILTSLGFVHVDTVKDEAGEIDELASSWALRSIAKTKNTKRKPVTKKKSPGKKPPKNKKQVPIKKIDPDSPFAVLQALNIDKR